MKVSYRCHWVAYALSFIALANIGFSDAHAAPVVIVAPNANAAVEGSTANVFPFATTANSTFPDGFRYQQIYNASEFSALSGPGKITAIAFRPDTSALISGVPTALLTQPFGPYILPNMLVKLSTTSKAVDGLDLTFANNVGADETVVYNGTITLASAFTGGTPKDFDFVIHLTTPFVYNPAAGNLLLDITNPNGASPLPVIPFLDAAFSSTDPVSRVYATSATALTAPSNRRDTLGLVTQFTVVPTPRAYSAGLGLLALVAGAYSVRRCKISAS